MHRHRRLRVGAARLLWRTVHSLLVKKPYQVPRSSCCLFCAAVCDMRALEFYSGIGGLHYGLLQACPQAEVVAAFDLNEVANDTYEHNFGLKPMQVNVGKIRPRQLDGYSADLWMLSPPCQPYTRKGLRKDSEDGRAESFLEILTDILPAMKKMPRYLIVENVVGFETSDTHQKLVSVLNDNGYALQEFILTPLQLGIPYSRPRYFALAKKQPLRFLADGSADRKPVECTASALLGAAPLANAPFGATSDPDVRQACVSEFLVHDPLLEWNGCEPQRQHPPDPEDVATCAARDSDDEGDPWSLYAVPRKVITQSGPALHAVSPSAKRINCFTKTYSRYAKATGSVLATRNVDRLPDRRRLNGGRPLNSAKKRAIEECNGRLLEPRSDEPADLAEQGAKSNFGEDDVGCPTADLGLRYFTPREVANFHSFPADFSFPSHVTLRQRYALLGNSLSVAVVADLLRYLLADPCAGE